MMSRNVLYRLCHYTVYVYWLRPNFRNYWNVEIVEYIKKKDVFRRGSSLEIYTSAAISKRCLNLTQLWSHLT